MGHPAIGEKRERVDLKRSLVNPRDACKRG
jgi:hypothetical protein